MRRLLCRMGGLRGMGAVLGLLGMLEPLSARASTLYTLQTTCSLQGASPAPCLVEAVDVGESTEYRHRIGSTTVVYRIFDEPYVRIEGRNPGSGNWMPVRNAVIHFPDNQLCFNDKALCVVNPNYLNSVREEAGSTLTGRELVGLAFGSHGRVEIVCFDEGCQRLVEALGR